MKALPQHFPVVLFDFNFFFKWKFSTFSQIFISVLFTGGKFRSDSPLLTAIFIGITFPLSDGVNHEMSIRSVPQKRFQSITYWNIAFCLYKEKVSREKCDFTREAVKIKPHRRKTGAISVPEFLELI